MYGVGGDASAVVGTKTDEPQGPIGFIDKQIDISTLDKRKPTILQKITYQTRAMHTEGAETVAIGPQA